MTLTQKRPTTAPALIAESAVVESAVADGPQEVFLRPRRWTTAEYYALNDTGVFDDERVELLDGEIWTLPAHGTPHFSAVRRAVAFLAEVFETGFDFRQQAPMTLEDGTEPEPDVLVVVGSWEDYEDHHPVPAEVRLLIEVSDATLRKDRGEKLRSYARAGIADYWIVNLVNRRLEVYRDPALIDDSYGYKTVQTLFDGDSITPLAASSGTVAVADLFPPLTP